MIDFFFIFFISTFSKWVNGSKIDGLQWDLLAQRHQHRRYEQEITGSQMDADAMWGKSRVLRWKLMRNLWFRIEAIMTFFGIVLLGSAWAS